MNAPPEFSEQLHALFGGDVTEADRWLRTPNELFGGKPPEQLLGKEGQEILLREFLERANAGDFS